MQPRLSRAPGRGKREHLQRQPLFHKQALRTPGPLDFLLGPGSGGTGTWSARLDTAAPVPEPQEDCLDGAPFTDFALLPRTQAP